MRTLLLFCFFSLITSCDQELELHHATPLNQQHQFRFDWCDFTYNSSKIAIGDHISNLTKTFGQYDRTINTTYVWDRLSLAIGTDKNDRVDSITIYFSLDEIIAGASDLEKFNREKDPYYKKQYGDIYNSKPKFAFQNSISIDGILIDSRFSGIEAINKARFQWAKEHHKTFPNEEYDPIMGKGGGTNVRFDKDGNVTFSKQINYFQEGFHPAQYVFNRKCGDQRLLFMIRLLSHDPSKLYRFEINLMNLSQLKPQKTGVRTK